MESIQEWFGQLGTLGRALFVLAYVFVSLLPVPTAPFTLAGGALFGFAGGVLVVAAATLIGSTLAYWLGRRKLKAAMDRMVERHPKLGAVERALQRDGWPTVMLLQLSPAVPFGVQNFFLGACRVKFPHYLLGTALGMLPSTLLMVFLGASGRAAMQDAGAKRWIVLGIGIAATILLTWRIGRMARRRLEA